jgi:hypothetical protein
VDRGADAIGCFSYTVWPIPSSTFEPTILANKSRWPNLDRADLSTAIAAGTYSRRQADGDQRICMCGREILARARRRSRGIDVWDRVQGFWQEYIASSSH